MDVEKVTSRPHPSFAFVLFFGVQRCFGYRCLRVETLHIDMDAYNTTWNRFLLSGTLVLFHPLTLTRQVALQKENANLKREYNMMTMAWYDLSSRVQSNTVILQRRSETSKSWINKQRHAINPMGRR